MKLRNDHTCESMYAATTLVGLSHILVSWATAFTARRYAKALCLSVCQSVSLSVYHKSVFY